MRAATSNQVRVLAKAVADALASSPLTEEERFPRQIAITDLIWQAPPLICTAELGGVPLQNYLDVPLAFDIDKMYAFWKTTLHDLWHTPTSVMKHGIFAGLTRAMSTVRVGQRAFRFSQPQGWPDALSEDAGVVFSLEVAHCVLVSCAVKRHVSDDDNYWVELHDGKIIGVVGGQPATVSPWNYSARGMVQILLESLRGEPVSRCMFDQIASVRSIVNVHKAYFKEHEGLDIALQALRLMTFGGHCPELVTAMVVDPVAEQKARLRAQVYEDALDVIKSGGMSDRSKLLSLKELLVSSGVLSANKFRRLIFSSGRFPFTMEPGRADTIQNTLQMLYEKEVPVSLRKEQ